MHSPKFYFYFVTLLSLFLGASTSQSHVPLFSTTHLGEPSSQTILAVKPKVEPKPDNSLIQSNKGILDDVKEDFEDVREDAVDVGEDIKDDAVDVGDDAADVGEDIKDDAVDVGEDATDTGEDIKDDAVDVGEDLKEESER